MELDVIDLTVDDGNIKPVYSTEESYPKNYLVVSFDDIVKEVRKEKLYVDLFEEQEIELLDLFTNKLKSASRTLYLKLYGRKNVILRQSSLKLSDEIDFDSCYNELNDNGLVSDDLSSFSTKEIVNFMNRKELVEVAKKFNINIKTPMNEICDKLLKLSAKRNSFFAVSSDPDSRMRKIISNVIKGAFFLTDKISIFDRAIFCVSLTSEYMGTPTTSFRNNLKSELFYLQQVRSGSLLYPTYTLNRKYRIFSSKDEIQSYLGLIEFSNEMHILFENKRFTELEDILQRKKERLLNNLHDKELQKLDGPVYLRRFSKSSVACSLLRLLVKTLEKNRKYNEAADLIKYILVQDNAPSPFCFEILERRKIGKLINRYVIDKASHSKLPNEAIQVLNILKIDLRSGEKLTLQNQINKIVSQLTVNNDAIGAKKQKFDATIEESSVDFCFFDDIRIKEPKLVKLTAPVSINNNDIGHLRPMFLWQNLDSDGNESLNVLRVEDWVARYYKEKLGYSYAIHCESSLYLLIFVLLFYDIIYDSEKSDVFYSYRQMAPLDMFYDEFYSSRKENINERLDLIKKSSKLSENKLCADIICKTWSDHYGERCLIINWEMFENVEDIVEIFSSLGSAVVHAFCEKLSTDYRNWRSGLPDLFIWSPFSHKYVIVEVKGPGDKLSNQQKAWLDVLISSNANVEVCHVEAVSKRKVCN